jgi:hypothetical protein
MAPPLASPVWYHFMLRGKATKYYIQLEISKRKTGLYLRK